MGALVDVLRIYASPEQHPFVADEHKSLMTACAEVELPNAIQALATLDRLVGKSSKGSANG
jgi:hypothetical protein